MKLLSEYLTYINVDNSKMYLNEIFIMENLSTYKWIQINLEQSNIIYYLQPYIKLVDYNSDFYKTYNKKGGFTVYDIFQIILDFEIDRNKVDRKLLFNGLYWNEKKKGYQILWEDS